jgi:hypothetical protein
MTSTIKMNGGQIKKHNPHRPQKSFADYYHAQQHVVDAPTVQIRVNEPFSNLFEKLEVDRNATGRNKKAPAFTEAFSHLSGQANQSCLPPLICCVYSSVNFG